MSMEKKEIINIWQDRKIVSQIEVPKNGRFTIQRISKERIGYITYDHEILPASKSQLT